MPTKKSVDSTPKPKIPLPSLKPCPICGGKGKIIQNDKGKECFASVICRKKECQYGTVTRRPKDGESNRENKIAAINEWNEGKIYPPDERQRLDKKMSRIHKKKKEAEKKARREAKRQAKKSDN